MMKVSAVFVSLCIAVSAYAYENVPPKELPALKPLNWCQHSDGSVSSQSEPCGPDSIAVSGITKRMPDGSMKYLPLGSSIQNTPLDENGVSAKDGESGTDDSVSNDGPNTNGLTHVETPSESSPSSATDYQNTVRNTVGGKQTPLNGADFLLFAASLLAGFVAKFMLQRSFLLWFFLALIGFSALEVLVTHL